MPIPIAYDNRLVTKLLLYQHFMMSFGKTLLYLIQKIFYFQFSHNLLSF